MRFLFFVQENVEKNESFKIQKTEQFLKFLNRSANLVAYCVISSKRFPAWGVVYLKKVTDYN